MPDKIQELIQRALGKAPSRALLTHCRRELFNAAQMVLLNDPEFQHAYKNGIVVKCVDGVVRRLFPRIFTYSADYPEKWVLYPVITWCEANPALGSSLQRSVTKGNALVCAALSTRTKSPVSGRQKIVKCKLRSSALILMSAGNLWKAHGRSFMLKAMLWMGKRLTTYSRMNPWFPQR